MPSILRPVLVITLATLIAGILARPGIKLTNLWTQDGKVHNIYHLWQKTLPESLLTVRYIFDVSNDTAIYPIEDVKFKPRVNNNKSTASIVDGVKGENNSCSVEILFAAEVGGMIDYDVELVGREKLRDRCNSSRVLRNDDVV